MPWFSLSGTNIESLELSELAKMPHVTGQVLQTLAQMDLQYLRLASGKCKDEKMLYDEVRKNSCIS